METAFGPLVLHLDAYQVHNPPIMEALEGACCVHCGYEPPVLHPTPTQRRHWCRLRRLLIWSLRRTNSGRLGVIERTDCEMLPGLMTRSRLRGG